MFSSKRAKLIAAGIAVIAIGGGSYGAIAATSSSATTTTTTGSSSGSTGHPFAGGSGSGAKGANAKSGPAAGGTIGTVSSVSASGFTVTTSASQQVTINSTSSTSYEKGTGQATASAVTVGQPVLVLGTTGSTTITATEVIVQPPPAGGTSPGGQVIPYAKGEKGSAQSVGTIPSDYNQGSGTLATGTTAAKATEAALAAYPGGVVDRVVELGNGDYEVHNIGVNWPHHIFVNSDFQVIGANS
jgi:hypothetical protein